jgi:hypothetical protein
MFELTKDEYDSLRCQIGALNEQGRGQHPKYLPYAFTEQGVAQLSSVLNSQFAIKVNIEIIRAFVVLRQYALGYAELNAKLEAYMQQSDAKINDVYLALDEFLSQKRLYENRQPIGFDVNYDEDE